MYILTASGKAIIDFDKFARVFTADTGDNVLVSIAATYNQDQIQPVTIGRYANMAQAIEAVKGLFEAIEQGKQTYWMPAGVPETVSKIHDARTKRKGGS